jgi:superfamily I DNA/RNA helicase
MMPLTEEQRRSLWDHTGQPVRELRVLSAKPGTGKTTTLTDYCIDIVTDWRNNYQPWQGMALVSYTNVAKDELELKIRRLGKANTLLKPPHFVGTLDAFVNQHIFLPYGTPIMQCAVGRPTLVGEPYHQWKTPGHLYNDRPANAYSPIFFDCYSIGIDGTPFIIDGDLRYVGGGKYAPAPRVTGPSTAKILSMKNHVWRHGMALQSDANYIAYQALYASPLLTKALVGRFPILVVDEAQDMTEIQHTLIDHLVAAGHRNVILVGDENQAIYEWNTARPQLFIAKNASTTWRATGLTGSFRCSPAICATLTTFADDGVTLRPAAHAKNVNYDAPVGIKGYEPGLESEAVRNALAAIARQLSGKQPHNANQAGIKTVAVLTRSAEDARILQAKFTGITLNPAKRTAWNSSLTRDYLRVIHLLRRGDLYAAAGVYETMLVRAGRYNSMPEMRVAHMARQGLQTTDTVGYRVILFRDLTCISDSIPSSEGLKISDCGVCCGVALSLFDGPQLSEVRQDCNGFTYDAKRDQDRLLSTLFTTRDERTWIAHPDHSDVQLIFSTAHGVKGETYDGVVFYTKKRTSLCGCPDPAVIWSKILNHSISSCETKRIAYVALSRAAQMLVVLAPSDIVLEWQRHTSQPRL